ncbi:hypothetical protein GCM10020358_36170 [Amorphoplanes nipponensis]|uniref:Uncharacterized protein n=2 Tax=Actinoplanes nipponensis TaxID=135950 RepID=A0A919JGP7_9ACTN|nr:hypothetical protein Ani05nite_25090 [Actinoplanes nipponensis]
MTLDDLDDMAALLGDPVVMRYNPRVLGPGQGYATGAAAACLAYAGLRGRLLRDLAGGRILGS